MRFSAARRRFKDNALKNRTTVQRTATAATSTCRSSVSTFIDLGDRLDKDRWVHQIHTHELVTIELRSIGCEEGSGI